MNKTFNIINNKNIVILIGVIFMSTHKVEIELNDDQFEKFKILEENGISAGEAIVMLFDVKENIHKENDLIIENKIREANDKKEELTRQMEKIDNELSFYSQLKDSDMDFKEKQEILEKEYTVDDTYEIEVQKVKRNISWAKDFFNF